MEILKKGEDYDKLKPQYIIFICTFDPFGSGFFRYRFSNLCHEDTALELGDETMKVFLNTKGNLETARKLKEQGIPAEIIAEATGLSMDAICEI